MARGSRSFNCCTIVLILTFLPMFLTAVLGVSESVAAPASYTVSTTADTDRDCGSVSVSNCSLREAVKCSSSSATIYVPSGTYTLTNGVVTVAHDLTISALDQNQRPTISGNDASRIFYVNSGIAVDLNYLIITHGAGVTSGGGLATESGTLNLTGCEVSHCQATGAANSDGGGAIYVSSGSLSLTDTVIDSNDYNYSSAGGNGGGGILVLNGSFYMTGSSVTNNTADNSGGGIYLSNNNTTTIISNSVIQGNQAGNSGGGIVNYYSPLTLNGCTVSGNSSDGSGGGLYHYISLTSTNNLVMSDCTFYGNSATNGNGGGLSTSGFSNIATSVFENNTSAMQGGGIYSEDNELYLNRCAVVNNQATGNGGGVLATAVHTTEPSTLSILNTTLAGNQSGAYGGGVYIRKAINKVSFATVYDNVSNSDAVGTQGGGGIYFGNAITTSTLDMKNTILAGNQSLGGPTEPDLLEMNAGYVAGTFNLIGQFSGVTLVNGVDGNQVGSASSPINPRLAAPADNGGSTKTCAIKRGSPALDAGSVPCTDVYGAAVSVDQRGFIRPQLEKADIGAYEALTKPAGGSTGNLMLLLD